MLSNDYLFSNIGIDSLSFFSPRSYVDLCELAKERNIDPDKYTKGLLSKEMRIPEVDEDVVWTEVVVLVAIEVVVLEEVVEPEAASTSK